MRGARAGRWRRLVVTVCSRESGVVALPIEPGGARRRLDAAGVRRELEALVERRRLGSLVTVREACAGGCFALGPNISVTIFPPPRAGERPNQVAVGWRTYVYSIRDLESLAAVIDDNLIDRAAPGRAAPTRSGR